MNPEDNPTSAFPITDDQPALGVDGAENYPEYNSTPAVGDVSDQSDKLPRQMENPSGN